MRMAFDKSHNDVQLFLLQIRNGIGMLSVAISKFGSNGFVGDEDGVDVGWVVILFSWVMLYQKGVFLFWICFAVAKMFFGLVLSCKNWNKIKQKDQCLPRTTS